MDRKTLMSLKKVFRRFILIACFKAGNSIEYTWHESSEPFVNELSSRECNLYKLKISARNEVETQQTNQINFNSKRQSIP